MSATIGDPADLSRLLGTEPIAMVEVNRALSGSTLGRRSIPRRTSVGRTPPCRQACGCATPPAWLPSA